MSGVSSGEFSGKRVIIHGGGFVLGMSGVIVLSGCPDTRA